MDDKIFTKEQLIEQLLQLGVQRGGVLLVHCSFSQVKPVDNGVFGLIDALQAVLGSEGTLVMPSMTEDDEHPFDPTQTPCMGMGIVAHTFWQLPGTLRSDSPHAFAACGPHAAVITASHPLDVPHGLNSPVGRVYELNGQVLLLGVGHDANTTIHLAENISGVRYRRQASLTILKDGQYTPFHYTEIDHCCQNFRLLDEWLDQAHLQQYGRVGHAQTRHIAAQDIVQTAVTQIQKNETVFLHPFGVDEECDEARQSLSQQP